jgi:hypothetical protein
MRKIISFMHISLDGFVAGPKGDVSFPEIRPIKNRKLITSFTNFKWKKNEKDTVYRKSNHCYVETT